MANPISPGPRLLALMQAMNKSNKPNPTYLGRPLDDVYILEAFEPVFKAVFSQDLIRYAGSEN